MAVPDPVIVGAHSSVANDASLTIAAGATTQEAVVHNVYAASGVAWELYRTDGANTILVMSGVGPLLGQVFHVGYTDAVYMTLKNKSGGTVYLGFDGFRTK